MKTVRWYTWAAPSVPGGAAQHRNAASELATAASRSGSAAPPTLTRAAGRWARGVVTACVPETYSERRPDPPLPSARSAAGERGHYGLQLHLGLGELGLRVRVGDDARARVAVGDVPVEERAAERHAELPVLG